MKFIYVLFLSCLFSFSLFAQTIDIEDAQFRAYLIAENYDTNGDGQIQVSEALAIEEVVINHIELASISGIKEFPNLKQFTLKDNNLSVFDISGHPSLEEVIIEPAYVGYNKINLANCSSLISFLSTNDLSFDTLDLTNCISLRDFYIDEIDHIQSLILTNCSGLERLQLESFSIASFSFEGCTGLKTLILDLPGYFEDAVFNGLTSLDSVVLTGHISSVFIENLPNLTYVSYDSKGDFPPDFEAVLTDVPRLKHVFMEPIIERFELDGQPDLETVHLPNGPVSVLKLTNCPTLNELQYSAIVSDTIDLSGAILLSSLEVSDVDYVNLTNCKSIQDIDTDLGTIRNLDCTGMSFLERITLFDGIEDIELSGCYNLKNLSFGGMSLMEELDLSSCISLSNMHLGFCENLETLILKNGVQESITFSVLGSLSYVCADQDEIPYLTQVFASQAGTAVIDSTCQINNANKPYSISGSSIYDINKDSCKTSEQEMAYVKYKVSLAGGGERFFFTDEEGEYFYYLPEGNYTYGPELQNEYEIFSLIEEENTISFPMDELESNVDFCYTSTEDVDIVEVSLLPLEPARPGFEAKYRIVYTNKGSIVKDGDIILEFQSDLMELILSDPIVTIETGNSLSWSFEELLPFETRVIDFVMELNTPMDTPPLTGESILEFEASISPIGNYDTEVYWSSLSQQVVNSYDPNDKTCLDGDELRPEMVGEYLKYMIRFENTGTADAINVVVTDSIDPASFDIRSLEVLDASHELITEIEGNIIKFVFDDINLPFDDANNDGYVTFKLKTLGTLELDHDIRNKAEIFFDFNFPIITNTASTVVKEFVATKDVKVNSFSIEMFPNPTSDAIQIVAEKTIDKVEVRDVKGHLVSAYVETNNSMNYSLNISNWQPGVYFVHVYQDEVISSRQLIVE